MTTPLPPSSTEVNDTADKASAKAFVEQGLLATDPSNKPFDQDKGKSTVADRNLGLLPPDKPLGKFLDELAVETRPLRVVDAGEFATKGQIEVEYVPTESNINVDVAAA